MVKVTQADYEVRKQLLAGSDGTISHAEHILRVIAAHRLATIEECAKVSESDLFAHEECDVAESIADAIRALKGGNND